MKVAIVLALLVAVASASPLLDALERMRRHHGHGGHDSSSSGHGGSGHHHGGHGSSSGGHGGPGHHQGGHGSRGSGEGILEAAKESQFYAIAPLSIDDAKAFKDSAVQTLGAVQQFFSEAANDAQKMIEAFDTLSNADKLDEIESFLDDLKKLDEESKEDFADMVAVAFRAVALGVGENRGPCTPEDEQCIEGVKEKMEREIKKKMKGRKGGHGPRQPAGEEKGCKELKKALDPRNGIEADPKQVAAAVVADLTCVAGLIGELKDAVEAYPPVDENTTGADILKELEDMCKPAMGIHRNVGGIARYLWGIKHHLEEEVGTSETATQRALKKLLRSLN